MHENRIEGEGRIAPPAVTRTVPEGQRSSVPLMPPFVPGRPFQPTPAGSEAAPLPVPADPAEAPSIEPAIEPPTVEPAAVAAAAADVEPMPWEMPAEPAPAAPAPAPVTEEDVWPLLSEQGSAEPAWDNGDEITGGPAEFPLDAFIIPEDSQRLPSGYEEEQSVMAERVAARLDDLARQVRAHGLGQLGAPGADELARIIATAVAGYIGRGGDA